MKKVLFIISRFAFGGAERQLTYLISGLDRTRFRVHIGFLYDEGNDTPLHTIGDTSVVTFGKKSAYDPRIFFRIARYIRENDIDIVQTFLGNHHAFLPTLFNRAVIPVGGIRCTFDEEFGFVQRVARFWLPLWIARRRPFLIVSNSTLGKNIYAHHGFPEKSLCVIENGIDYPRFAAGDGKKVRKEFSLEDKFVIGNIGRMSEEKNQEALLHIFHELSKKHKNLALMIIGNGPLKERLAELTKDLDITDKVIFTGNRTDIPDCLHAMDLFFLPSRSEAWPNVLGEAMAAGLACVAYRTGDVEYIIETNVNGIMTEQNKGLFIRAAIPLIKDPERRRLLGRNAAKTIREKYSVQRMVHRYEEFYEGLV